MFLQKLLQIIFQIILVLQFIAASTDEVDVDELKLQISSHLSYTARRLRLVQQNVEAQYAEELEQLLARYLKAANAEDPLVEEKLLLEYEGEQRQTFIGYLSLQYDEQFLNEDIRIQEWSMRQLLSQLGGGGGGGPVAEEIEKMLPAYETAAKIEDFDKKYAAFAEIQEGFSPALWQLLDAEPEDVMLLNVQLQFFREFLMYLLKHEDARQFTVKLRNVLAEVEAALASADVKQKVGVLDSFDDLTTKFGRFFDYKILEFEFDRFGR
ncbi:uncharacterized protein LOC118735519 [Rhagoletis pomonella]|uniref:uncharacterized protein LOC118735519 n=1 Tax=Rhagoletis pomonella TaxID=28610 RepID=UPI0017802FC8|nr:uncharacterized protein LOC118735519 [Rhagoletis pomonella]